MKRWWKIFVLWVFWVPMLWLMAPYLDPTPESALQEKQTYSVPRHHNYAWFKFWMYGCPSGACSCSPCHHRVGEWSWFGARHGKTRAYLRTKVPRRLGRNSINDLGKVWKMLKMIPRPLVRHFDLYCVTCVVPRNSQIPQGSGLSDTDQHHMVFRVNQASAQGFETPMGNQTTGPFFRPRNASDRSSWGQWLLQFSNLA